MTKIIGVDEITSTVQRVFDVSDAIKDITIHGVSLIKKDDVRIDEAIRYDYLNLIACITDEEAESSRSVVDYINNCLGTDYSLTQYDRKILSLRSAGMKEACTALAILAIIDALEIVPDTSVCDIYIQIMGYFAVGYLLVTDKANLEQVSEIYATISECCKMAKSVTGKDIDVDFLSTLRLSEDEKDLIRACAVIRHRLNENKSIASKLRKDKDNTSEKNRKEEEPEIDNGINACEPAVSMVQIEKSGEEDEKAIDDLKQTVIITKKMLWQ